MHATGVGFFVSAGIPKGPRVNVFEECGCCGAFHRADFNGDCREDSERHWELPMRQRKQFWQSGFSGGRVVADVERIEAGLNRDDDNRSECDECGHPFKEGDETHYPECSQVNVR